MIGRPENAEAAPYYFSYIDQATGDDPVGMIAEQFETSRLFFRQISEERSLHRYSPDK